MGEVHSTVRIEMPRQKAWEILRDLTKAHSYVPGIVDTVITTEQVEGVGTSRIVYQSKTRGLNETVVEWNDGYGFLIRLHRGEKGAPPPFKEAYFRYAIADDGDATSLTTSLIYTLGMGWFGKLLETLLLKRIFERTIADVALSMKHFYETGRPTRKEDLKRMRGQVA